jgi:transposase
MGCRPLARITSAGQRHDSLAFGPLMSQLAIARPAGGPPRTRPGRVLGDKAYSSTAIRAHLRRRGIKATIPEPSDQVRRRQQRGSHGGRPPAFSPKAYKDRNTVERAFSQLRQHRVVATRYDKRDFVWRGTINVATIRTWLRHPALHDLKDTP